MSNSILHKRHEDLDTLEKRRSHRISILGCSRDGLLHALLFAEAGFQVTCIDADRALTSHVAKGRAPFLRKEVEPLLRKHLSSFHLTTTSRTEEAITQSSVVIVTTRATVDKKRRPSHSNLERVCKQIGESLQPGSLVIIMCPLRPNTTETLIKETLEDASGFKAEKDFGLAYSPLPVLAQSALKKLANSRRIVAARSKESLNAAVAILKTITEQEIATTHSIRTAEATKLFEAVQHYTEIALANEYTLLCNNTDLDYFQVRELAETSGFSVFPPPTLSCSSIQEEPYLLLEEAERINVKMRLPKLSCEINNEILKHSANLIKEALKNCGKTLRRAKITILGITQTPNTSDRPKASAKRLARILEKRGAKVTLYDPYLSGKELTEQRYTFKRRIAEATEGADCVAILTKHDRLQRLNLKKLKIMVKMPAAIVDFEGTIDPEKAEKEGFTYRRLGRGVYNK